MFRTIKYEVDKSHPLYDYFYQTFGFSKCLYNATNYYIRNTMTGVQKENSKLTTNEQEVLDIITQVLPVYDKTKQKTLKKKIDKIKKDDKLSPIEKQDKIDTLNKKYKAPTLPTADKWFLSYNMLDAVFKYTNNVDYLNLPSQVNKQ